MIVSKIKPYFDHGLEKKKPLYTKPACLMSTKPAVTARDLILWGVLLEIEILY